jgi:hypothetical protein
MSKEIKLPSGATATLREASELRQKDRDKLYPILTEANAESASHLAKTLIAILVEEWSFDLLPPSVKLDSLGELTLGDYDALEAEATAIMPALFPALKDVTDPKATVASSTD